jgi:crotonobetainyl-CoA:carnitine CoA-transferase CaiB-like acyl-CoA transferase
MPILPRGFSINLPGEGLSKRYARTLLEDLGASVIATPGTPGDHPARRWADSGLMVLTGRADNAPVMCPVPLASCADGALEAFRGLTAADLLPTVAGSQLLAERAAITGYRNNATGSLGGHCRLLDTADGVIGLNLARDDDRELLFAWLGRETAGDWESVAALVKLNTSKSLLEQGRLLGLAVVDAQAIPSRPCSWMNALQYVSGGSRPVRPPTVLDLSSLWAGPLCSHLWQAAGAEVIKIEGSRRPDGARSGSAEFFELLNHGKRSITLDLHEAAGQKELRALIQQADIVLEGSRPRALRQMGIIAEDMIREQPGLSWVSITGYGRQEPQANWVAFGDDAGVAAGLSAILHEATGQWLICGDAIADPLTGLHTALAGWASWLAGGGRLIEVSLEQTVRHCITATAPAENNYRERQARWVNYLENHGIVAQPPRRRSGAPASAP